MPGIERGPKQSKERKTEGTKPALEPPHLQANPQMRYIETPPCARFALQPLLKTNQQTETYFKVAKQVMLKTTQGKLQQSLVFDSYCRGSKTQSRGLRNDQCTVEVNNKSSLGIGSSAQFSLVSQKGIPIQAYSGPAVGSQLDSRQSRSRRLASCLDTHHR